MNDQTEYEIDAAIAEFGLEFPLRRSVQMVQNDAKGAQKAFRAAAEASAKVCPSCLKPVKHRKGLEWCQDHQMSEETLTKRVLYRARKHGWDRAHAGRAFIPQPNGQEPIIITPMAPGWLDWTFAKAGHSLIFMELKKEDGKLSEDQMKWIDLLNRTGNFAMVVRPSDLRAGRVEAVFREGAPL